MAEVVEEITAEEQAELDKLEYTTKRYLTPKEIAAYVLVNFGQKNLSQFVDAFKEFFMIQFLKLNTTVYANINLFASIYDAVDDTISGLIIDRTRTRWGRIRPFFIVPLPLWLVGGYMMFTAPTGFSSTAKTVWALIAIIVYGLGMSYFGAWGLMIYNITPNSNERNNLITTTKFFELFGTWLPSLVPVLVTLLPKLNKSITMKSVYSGFAYFMLALAACFAIFGFFNIRERVPLMSREEMNETSVFESIKQIFTNRPLFTIILGDFFNSFKSVGGSSESYFWLNNTGSLLNQTVCGLFTGIPNYLMVPLAAKIANLAFVIFGLTICGLPNKIIQVVGPMLCAETFDWMEWKHGMRNEALVTTVQGYFTKLATSVTGWLSGMVLTWINYVPLTDSLGNAIPQTDPSMLEGIWAIFCILPAIARGFYGLSFILYPIHGKMLDQMTVELADIRADRLAEQERLQQEQLNNNTND